MSGQVAGRALPAPGARTRGRTWALDEMPGLRLALQRRGGQVLLVAVFAALAQWGGVGWPYVLAAAGFAHFRAWRPLIALGAAVLGLARSAPLWLHALAPQVAQAGLPPATAKALVLAMLALYLAWAWAVLGWTRRHPRWWLARRPVLGQWAIAALLAALASLPLWPPGLHLALWLLLCIWGTQMWLLAYALQDQRTAGAAPMAEQLGWLHPFWRAGAGTLTATPLGKGAAFLRRHQAASAEALAVTQLKAFKLLVWALVLGGLNTALLATAARLGLPTTEAIYAAFLAGQPHGVLVHWASLAVASASAALSLAAIGHKVIAVARLAGFALPRNTWRPLQARTLAEFWNRYYYYFKELLVDFFFYPTFFRCLRAHPRLRLFLATFMAAGVGNAAFHFLRDIHLVAQLGWQAATVGYASNLVYCTVLALGIAVSQARMTAGRQLPEGWLGRLWAFLCVWGFFVALRVFGDESRSFALEDRWAFFLSLFGA